MFKKNKKYILDGGSGQTLMEMGLRTTGDLWSAKALIDANLHSLVLKMHKQGVKVLPWTVNSSNTFNKLREMGVDGVITDYPHVIYNK